jgi:uncharacterized protein YajQ (UPF0234 family)
MTKNLEEAFDLPPIKEAIAKQKGEVVEIAHTPEEALENSAKILKALTITEKVDHALTTVDNISAHDIEMDDIAQEALESYTELKELGMNMSDAHSGRMMEVAASMLRTALDARSEKMNRKLKTIDLQLKKMRIDNLNGKNPDPDSDAVEFDRNELLKHIYIQREEE